MSRVRSGGWLLIFLLAAVAAGCGAPQPGEPVAESTEAEVVARYDGGRLTFRELEAAVLTQGAVQGTGPGGQGLEELEATYRETAELEVLSAELYRTFREEEPIHEDWEQELELLEHRARAQSYLRTEPLDLEPVTDEEIREHFEEHRASFRQEARRQVYHLFRRQRPGESPSEVRAALEALRQRVDSGERFQLLAKELSDSENRLLGGALGWVRPDDLPADLRQVVFSLEEQQVSEPLMVAGGGVLIFVELALPAREPALEDHRQTIRTRLEDRRIGAAVAERTAELELPEGTVLPDRPYLGAALAGLPSDDILLATPSVSLTVAQFARRLAQAEGAASVDTQEAAAGITREDVQRAYDDLRRVLLLSLAAQDAGFPETPQQEAALETGTELLQRAFLNGKLLEQALELELAGSQAELKAFFEDNRARFQSPLEMHLRTLVISNPERPGDLQRVASDLRRLEERSRRGETVDLEAEAERLGGQVTDLGRLSFAALRLMPPKVRSLVVGMTEPGLTVPFQLEGSLRLLELVERYDPQPLTFGEARSQVQQAYLHRHGQQLFLRWKQSRLEELGFSYDADAVRRRLLLEDSPES